MQTSMQTKIHSRAYEFTNTVEIQFRDTGFAEVKPRGQVAATDLLICFFPHNFNIMTKPMQI